MKEDSSPRGHRPLYTVILGAGKGKRMHSERAKVLHPLAGRPMLDYVVRAALKVGASRLFVVLGSQSDEVRKALASCGGRLTYCLQRDQRGTAHAVLQTQKYLDGKRGDVLILNGDVPALRDDLLRHLLHRHRESGAAATLVTALLEDPAGYGRIVRNPSWEVSEIVEDRDARPEEREIKEVNCGLYVIDCGLLFPALRQVTPFNQQRELYLTEVVRILKRGGHKVMAMQHDDPEEVLGVNTRRELAVAAKILYRRKAEELMQQGVSFVDPWHTYVEVGVKVGLDTFIYPDVYLEGSTEVGRGCRIDPGCVIRDCVLGDGVRVLAHSVLSASRVHAGAQVGPFTHLRPESEIGARARIGNFVEIKKSKIGEEVRAGHLSYLGDARLGRRVNVGAGTITCNYDGQKKYPTVLEDDVFVGSDTQFVAPVTVRRGAYVGAGSTITQDVPAWALALSRSPQQNREGWVRRRQSEGARSASSSSPSARRASASGPREGRRSRGGRSTRARKLVRASAAVRRAARLRAARRGVSAARRRRPR